MEGQGVQLKYESNDTIVNKGSLILNRNSEINNQEIATNSEQKDSGGTKTNVIVALIGGIATIFGIIWSILKC